MQKTFRHLFFSRTPPGSVSPVDLNNLSQLLADRNRLFEAKPLARRVLAIVVDFKRRNGLGHPNYDVYCQNYRDVLSGMNLPHDEIEQLLKKLTQ